MKQTVKFSATMVLLLASMTMMAGTDEITTSSDQKEMLLALDNPTNENNDPGTATKKKEAKPVFIQNGETVYLMLDNPNLGTMQIEVRDGMGRLVYSETISENEDILKAFNFKKAFKGSYTIKVNNGADSFTKNIDIR